MNHLTIFALGLLALGLHARPASACGNTTHAWISIEAVGLLPEGELRDLLSAPDADRHLRNGTLFPDGGYAIGDGYGETAHWEPFQDAYLDWIRSTYQPPWSDEARAHLAFWLGMASHGLADQVYDGVFMEHSKARDRGWRERCDSILCAFDSATDFLWASLTGPQTDPERWLPGETFTALYADHFHHQVSEKTMRDGTDRVGAALLLAGEVSRDASLLFDHEQLYPWAFEHMDEPRRGAPRHLAKLVAAYWQALWHRLEGGAWVEAPVLGTHPSDGAWGHPRDADDVGARISLVFSRALSQAALDPSLFHVVDSKGEPLAVSVDLFYRDASNVVNLHPSRAFDSDETYTVAVDTGVVDYTGVASTRGYSFKLHTTPPKIEPAPVTSSSCRSWGGPSALAWLAALVLTRRVRR